LVQSEGHIKSPTTNRAEAQMDYQHYFDLADTAIMLLPLLLAATVLTLSLRFIH